MTGRSAKLCRRAYLGRFVVIIKEKFPRKFFYGVKGYALHEK